MSITDTDFTSKYISLIEQFKKNLISSGINLSQIDRHLPAPFIPTYGKYYSESKLKIAFVGQDANYNPRLNQFFDDPEILWFSDVVNYDELDPSGYPELLNYTKGNSFWKFVLKILASVYQVDDWSNISNDWKSELNKKILGSFVHGNVYSVPNIIPDKYIDAGVNIDVVKKIKEASKIFDKLTHVINVFKPNVVLLTHWNANDDWFDVELGEPEKLDPKCVWYYFIKKTNTHLYWTKHPSGMRYSEPEEIPKIIINSMKEKGILDLSYP